MSESDELSRLLAAWAARHRLSSAQVSGVRAQVLATGSVPDVLDADWLWSLLRPVTALVEHLDREPGDATVFRPTGFGQQWTTYLQLA